MRLILLLKTTIYRELTEYAICCYNGAIMVDCHVCYGYCCGYNYKSSNYSFKNYGCCLPYHSNQPAMWACASNKFAHQLSAYSCGWCPLGGVAGHPAPMSSGGLQLSLDFAQRPSPKSDSSWMACGDMEGNSDKRPKKWGPLITWSVVGQDSG